MKTGRPLNVKVSKISVIDSHVVLIIFVYIEPYLQFMRNWFLRKRLMVTLHGAEYFQQITFPL